MKKIICLILAVLMLATFLVACDGGSETKTTRPYTPPTSGPNSGITQYFGDETVKIYTRDNTGAGNDGEYLLLEFKGNTAIKNPALNDAVLSRNQAVEGQLGVTLKITANNGGMDNAATWNSNVKSAATAEKNDLFDICALYASQGSPLAAGGAFLDVNLLPENTLNLDQPWWNQILKDELNIDGSIFMICGDLSLSSTAFSVAVFYNKNIYKEAVEKNSTFLNDIYEDYRIDRSEDEREAGYNYLHDMIETGGWTISNFTDIVNLDGVTKNANSIKGDSPDDRFGLSIDNASNPLDAWVAALDVNIVNYNAQSQERTLAYATKSELNRATQAWTYVKNLIEAPGVHAFKGEDIAINEFKNGQSLFTIARLCDAESFRDTKDWEYGILPLPSYDVSQDNYYTLPHNAYSLIAVAANVNKADREVVGCTLEVLGCESLRTVTPAYFNVILKGQYSDKQVDAEMYDLILDNIRLDFAAIFSTQSLGGIGNTFRNQETSVTRDWDMNKSVYQDALTKLVQSLKEQAALQQEYLK